MGRVNEFVDELKLRLSTMRQYVAAKVARFATAENATEYVLLSEIIDMVNAVSKKYTDDQPVDITIHTEDGWTLCSDRLPDKTGWYLVTYVHRSTNDKRYLTYTTFRGDRRWDEEALYPSEKVIAWKGVDPYEKPLL